MENDLIASRPAGIPFHCVAIHGHQGRLVAYVEYFGVRRIWVPLSNHYDGPELVRHYALNPVTGKVVQLQLRPLPLAMRPYDVQSHVLQTEQALHSILKPALKASHEKEGDRVLRETWEAAWKQIGLKPGQSPTDAQKMQFSQTVMERMMPYLLHHADPICLTG